MFLSHFLIEVYLLFQKVDIDYLYVAC